MLTEKCYQKSLQDRYIVISPYSKRLFNGEICAKNYPYWKKVLKLLERQSKIQVVQIGVNGEVLLQEESENFVTVFNAPLAKIEGMVLGAKVWVSVDNFLQHLMKDLRRGIVVWGKSDPLIFGYDTNINILKDRSYLRPNQFDFWETEKLDIDCWVNPEEVADKILNIL